MKWYKGNKGKSNERMGGKGGGREGEKSAHEDVKIDDNCVRVEREKKESIRDLEMK